MNPIVRARRPARSSGLLPVTSCSLMYTLPDVGTSMQPIRFSNVDLPLPEGPATAMNTPRSIDSVTSRNASTRSPPTSYALVRFSTRTTLTSERVAHLCVHAVAIVELAEEAERRSVENVEAGDQLPVLLEVPDEPRPRHPIGAREARDVEHLRRQVAAELA